MSSYSKDKKTKKCIEEGKCLESLQLILDGEASPDEERQFMDHLEVCMPCYNLYQVDKAVKQLLQTRIEKKEVPDSMKEEIRKKIFFIKESA